MTMAAPLYHHPPSLAHSAHTAAERMCSSRWRDFRAERYKNRKRRTGNIHYAVSIYDAVERTSKYTYA